MDEWLNPTAKLLVEKNLLSFDSAYQYQQEAQAHTYPLLSYLVSKAKICPKLVAQTLAEHFSFPWVDLDQLDSESFPQLAMTHLLVQQHHVLPIFYQDHYLVLAIDDPNHPFDLKEIQFLTHCPIILYIAPSTQLNILMEEKLRVTDQQGLTQYLHTQDRIEQSQIAISDNSYDEKPIVTFVRRILQQAITRGATDLHFEPYADHYRIRYRQDGKLYELTSPIPLLASRVTSRLKIMANLNITERRLPQDGRFSFEVTHIQGSTSIDCRINTCPTIYGEKIAIRFLNTPQTIFNIEHLGLTERDKHCFLQAIQRSQGLILVTGPTGSGKTLSLYAALAHLNTGDKNIFSAEDPVEIKMSGINQVQINPKIGLGFAEVLRAFLRQDPDIIMLGEIRDYETADIAMKAAHTGHLVLATVHTQNCVQTLLRLKQLGIATFLMSNLILIMSQRLFRILCPHCKIPADKHTANIYQAQGCHRCHQGYQGRKAIFEVMPVSPRIHELIIETKLSTAKLTQVAIKEGMVSLKEAGFKYVAEGVTTIEEINAIT